MPIASTVHGSTRLLAVRKKAKMVNLHVRRESKKTYRTTVRTSFFSAHQNQGRVTRSQLMVDPSL